MTAVVAAVLAVLATATATAAHQGNPEPPQQTNPPAGTRFESSLGAQIAVPASWAVNDSGCGMTARPSVVRGKGLEPLCYSPEPPTKELAIIEESLDPAQETDQKTMIDEVTAWRGGTRLRDGRYAAWVRIPSRRVAVDVRTRDPWVTAGILHSVHLVDIDHLGCPTRQPPRETGAAPRTTSSPRRSTFVPAAPTSVSVCYYGGGDRLQASAAFGTDTNGAAPNASARRLAEALNAAPAGLNPDRPARDCDARADLPGDDAILLLRDGATTDGTVRLRFSSCTGGGMVNDAGQQARLTRTLVATIMAPVHAGYSVSADLPV
ncbi:hypothetical protein ACNTMW_24760 [Planosporangium sp. 12N6]|uniref:hypothetical protein n=1 Tax=Planosporangium spinosum TaxID=3402278 RepID=UPI003CF212D6